MLHLLFLYLLNQILNKRSYQMVLILMHHLVILHLYFLIPNNNNVVLMLVVLVLHCLNLHLLSIYHFLLLYMLDHLFLVV